MEIEQRIIDSACSAYSERFVFLKEARLDSDRENVRCYGRLEVPLVTYTKEPQIYLGCPDAVVCIGQIAYAAWAEILKEGIVDAKMNLEEFLRLPEGSMHMIAPDMKFRKAIKKEGGISGEIALERYRIGEGNTALILTKFDFESRALIGNVKFSIKGI